MQDNKSNEEDYDSQELDIYDLDCLGKRLFNIDNISIYIEEIKELLRNKQ